MGQDVEIFEGTDSLDVIDPERENFIEFLTNSD
jgi:hypothetical protein